MRGFIIALMMLALQGAASAQAPRRVALVVSNDVYANARALPNTTRDGDLVAATLNARGYNVRRVREARGATLRSELEQFSVVARGADTAVIYLAGHGIIDRGASRLVGVDAPIDAFLINQYAVTVADAFAAIGTARTRVVLFDACRESVFAGLRAPTPRGVGMATTGISTLRAGAYLAHAARAGAFAYDGPEGGNGPFVTALVARLADAGADVDFSTLLQDVRSDVARATNGRQEPALFLPATPAPPSRPATTVVSGDCADCPAVAAIAAGRFNFGSPATERGRDIDEVAPTPIDIAAFEITRHEITRGAFARFVADTGRVMAQGCEARVEGATVGMAGEADWRSPGFEQTDQHPVVCVDFEDARAYARWLSAKTGRTWRLPTEAEWEYAARAGTQTPYFWGEDRATCAWGNGDDLTAPVMAPAQCRDGYATTSPVGTFQPNAWGLHDTAGNVWEWTLDCDSGAAAAPPADGAARASGTCAHRTIRGGSFDYGPNFQRSASRHRLPPDVRNASTGFRLVRAR